MYALGETTRLLTDDEVAGLVRDALSEAPLDGKRVLGILPDGTRSAPIPELFRLICDALLPRVAQLDFLIALGTHALMNAEQINERVGVQPHEWETTFKNVHVYNHEWADPETFITLGVIPEAEIEEMSEGRLHEAVTVRVNRMVMEYDHLLICGPVFPHEVVGFSGGNKYLYPGVSGPEVINFSHWLGALITNERMIGTPGITPVRRMINRATAFIPTPRSCFALVVAPGTNSLAGIAYGDPEEAWQAAADLSTQLHVRYEDHTYNTVLSVMPHMYDDIWTAAKGMYKLEPVVADGGEVIIYAPHITEFSYTHGALLAEIGYHVRDYFVKQWDHFGHYPGGVLAHSTHLKGAGTWTPAEGERPRVRVTLATSISAERCAQHNLGYRDPATINPSDFANREDKGVLLVPKAGELLYRLRAEAPLALAAD